MFAGYTIEGLLGAGGMGVVYLARHPRMERRVALKVLNDAVTTNPRAFDREATLAARLDHPNIVTVYDRSAPEDAVLWLSMRHVTGGDANTLLAINPDGLPPGQAVELIADAAAALDYAHAQGVVHRDVKPANLLIEQHPRRGQQALLTDFGIARTLDDTVTLSCAGTFAYTAPERFSGEPADHRADIYSLGCTLHHLLTGQAPFPRASQAAVMAAHLTAPPPMPSRLREGLPAGLDTVIATALAKDPADRYPSCGELAHAAREALTPAPRPRPTSRDTAAATDASFGADPKPTKPRIVPPLRADPADSAPAAPTTPAGTAPAAIPTTPAADLEALGKGIRVHGSCGIDGPRRIGVVEDHQVTIAGLRQILAGEDTVTIVATAASVSELLAQTTDLALVVLALRLPDGSSPVANIERLRAAGIETLVFTSGDEPFLVRAAARAGVLGVVCKSERDNVVAAAVREAATGRQVPTVDWAVAIDTDDDFNLSPRQRDVLALYASGESAARVARLTGLTEATVVAYLERIRQKYAEAGPAVAHENRTVQTRSGGWVASDAATAPMSATRPAGESRS